MAEVIDVDAPRPSCHAKKPQKAVETIDLTADSDTDSETKPAVDTKHYVGRAKPATALRTSVHSRSSANPSKAIVRSSVEVIDISDDDGNSDTKGGSSAPAAKRRRLEVPNPKSTPNPLFFNPRSAIGENTYGKKKKRKKEEAEFEFDYTDGEDEDEVGVPPRSPDNDSPDKCPTVEPVERYEETPIPFNRRYADIGPAYRHPLSATSSSAGHVYIWDAIRMARALPYFKPQPRFISKRRPGLATALDMDHYLTTRSFRGSGGSINRILQHDGRVVICSNTAGGDTRNTDPYNKNGTLISWCKESPTDIHCFDTKNSRDPQGETYYTVPCISYNPSSEVLAASVADNSVRTWNFTNLETENAYINGASITYKAKHKDTAPHEIMFKPGSEYILAVAEQRVTIQNVRSLIGKSLELIPRNMHGDNIVGSIAWGSGRHQQMLFASSETIPGSAGIEGFHKAFDTVAMKAVYEFDAPEVGDALAMNPTGNQLALVTTGAANSFLRLFDIGSQCKKAACEIRLEEFASASREVKSMAFSSDGIYLALGRDDNHAHVYDTRFLKERGVLFDFRHSELSYKSPKHIFYGVVGLQWVETRAGRLGLVTGGNDGCIRLWNPLNALDEGTVLAAADSDIASFSLGDRSKGEHGLVIGDSTGSVYIMDPDFDV